MSDNRKKISATKNKIIDSAMKVFGSKGFHDSTISEIARAADISEATIYEYFDSKETLLFSIPEKFISETISETSKILPYIKGAENRLRCLLYLHYEIYRDRPNYSSVVLLNLKQNRNFMKTKSYQQVRKYSQILIKTIAEGMESGEFRSDLDPYLVRHILLGTIEHIFFRWHLLDRREPMQDFIDSMLDILLEGIRAKKEMNVKVSINYEDEYISKTHVSKNKNTTT